MAEPRFNTYFWTEFTVEESVGEGSVQNVGPGGLFVRSSTIGNAGDEVRLSFEGPDDETIEVIGVIWWTKLDLGGRGPGLHGFGVRLMASNGNYRTLLRKLAQPRRRSPRHSLAA